jgi:hypothetical protein
MQSAQANIRRYGLYAGRVHGSDFVRLMTWRDGGWLAEVPVLRAAPRIRGATGDRTADGGNGNRGTLQW